MKSSCDVNMKLITEEAEFVFGYVSFSWAFWFIELLNNNKIRQENNFNTSKTFTHLVLLEPQMPMYFIGIKLIRSVKLKVSVVWLTWDKKLTNMLLQRFNTELIVWFRCVEAEKNHLNICGLYQNSFRTNPFPNRSFLFFFKDFDYRIDALCFVLINLDKLWARLSPNLNFDLKSVSQTASIT